MESGQSLCEVKRERRWVVDDEESERSENGWLIVADGRRKGRVQNERGITLFVEEEMKVGQERRQEGAW